jgi:hypothetical protein
MFLRHPARRHTYRLNVAGEPRVISPELLAILRCPMDSQTPLAVEDLAGTGHPDTLLCTRCRVVFHNRDGFPTLLIEEAQLPPGCSAIDQLPCQRRP